MKRSATIAAEEGDVTSPVKKTLPFGDENLRGEKLKQYVLSEIKYQRRRKCHWYLTISKHI